MASHYYHNPNSFPVEIPLTYGGSMVLNPKTGFFVLGSTLGSFARQAVLGNLTDDGAGEPATVTADPTLLVYTEPPVPSIGPTGVAGDTGQGNTGVSGAKGDTGTKGDTGAKGDTGTP